MHHCIMQLVIAINCQIHFARLVSVSPVLVIISCTLSIRNSFTLSLQVQNLTLQQIIPTLTLGLLLYASYWDWTGLIMLSLFLDFVS